MEARKRCYYEVLDVARNASADELKVAYKKLVMKWHPDKNLDKAEEATERFKEIQSAYAVLGDPNERAWYDSHREAILRGKNPAEGTDSDDEEEQAMNLWPFFSSSCYKGFGSDDLGFYAVYRGVFSSIEEAEKAEVPDHVPLPSFGDAKTSSDDLLEFYRAWKNYTSDRSFGWAEQWKLSDAPNRQYRRAMEKDNKKKRDKKRKEFTELVRHLAEYVQKIDPRMQEALAARQKAEEEKQRAADARRKEEDEKRKKRVQELAARAAAEEEKDDEEKWERLMEGNPISRTKKDKKESENEEGDGDEPEEGEGDATTTPAAAAPVPAAAELEEEEEEEEEEGGYCAPCKKRFKSVQQLRQHKQQKKHKEIILALRRELAAQGETWDESEEEEKVSSPQQQTKGGKKKKKGRKQRNDEEDEELAAATEELNLSSSAPTAPAAAAEAKQENGGTEAADVNGQSEATEDGAAGAEGEEQGDEAEQTEASGKKPRRRRPKEERAAKGAYVCAACSASFAQRNALFSHLAATGHARPSAEVPAASAAVPKKGKRW